MRVLRHVAGWLRSLIDFLSVFVCCRAEREVEPDTLCKKLQFFNVKAFAAVS